MAQENLGNAKRLKNDEFYTQYSDIEAEMNAYLSFDKDVFRGKTVLLPCDDPEWSNFTRFFAQRFEDLGLKKLISTSYAPNSKPKEIPYQPPLFEIESPDFDSSKTITNGKIFTLTQDTNDDKSINFHDLEWSYLDGDGDFRSDEVSSLRDEADFVITNPPFSLFREFVEWILEGQKKFSVIGNMNALTYKEIFPRIKANEIWLGNNYKINGGAMYVEIPEALADMDRVREIKENENGKKVYITRVQGVRWFSNIEHGRRHEPLSLMTKSENLRFHNTIKELGYQKYDNYDAIEVPRVDAIPSDYEGVMGVPISFLDKYNPDQFEILGITKTWDDASGLKTKVYPQQTQISSSGARSKVSKLNDGASLEVQEAPSSTHYEVEGKLYVQMYARTLIRHRRL